MVRNSRLAVVLACGLLACSSKVIIPQQTGATGSGGTSSASAGSGAGGTSGTSTGSGGQASCGPMISSPDCPVCGCCPSSGGAKSPCDPSTQFVDIDGDGPPQHYDASCAPRAGYMSAGPLPVLMAIEACTQGPAQNVLGIGAYGCFPGTDTHAELTYLHGGETYEATCCVLTLTTVEGQGGVIEGTFSATVVPAFDDAGAPIAISGKLRLCRGMDGCGVCASPDTPIATPSGSVPIAALRPGDLVYSVEDGAVVTAPLVLVSRTAVREHHVVRVALQDGAVLEISAGHPTADGRTFGDLRAGGELDGHAIASAERVPYPHAFTYDILPATRSATYYAGGALVGSTLAR